MNRHAVITSLLLLCSVGCGGEVPDSAGVTTDARPGATDARPGAADAQLGAADARPGAADAQPGAADAQPGAADAGSTPQPDAGNQSYDCANLPEAPLPIRVVPGAIASEDLAFDGAGNLVGSNDTTIFRTPYGGTPAPWTQLSFRSGMRMLPSGDLVVANGNPTELVRVSPDGTQSTIISGLSGPNGLAIDPRGYIYVTEMRGDRVLRVDPATGDYRVLVEGTIHKPNGLTFNAAYDTLYIAGFTAPGVVYRLPIDADGNPGTLSTFATDVGSGALDGLGMDACGNLYVCDYGNKQVLRISPDGQTKVPIISHNGAYMPNLQWGSGVGGWDDLRVYLPDGRDHLVYEVDLGVPSKGRVYP